MNLFDFFGKNKEFISCEWIEHGVHFMTIGINHCCMYSHSKNNDKPLSELVLDKNNKIEYNFNDFLSKKKRTRQLQRKGVVDKRCEGCFNLEKKVWDNTNKYTRIAIDANTKCNANCIYCYTHKAKELYNLRQDISIFSILKKLIDENKIDIDCQFQIAGGEPTLHFEFEDIIKLLLDNSFTAIRVNTSGIKYSKMIEKGIKEDKLIVCISPDSGDRELYKKIKNIDASDEVWNNIAEYAKVQSSKSNRVHIKYIVIPNFNDTEEDIQNFINKIIENNVRYIIIDFELLTYRKEKSSPEFIKKMFKLVKYFEENIQNPQIMLSYGPAVESAKAEFREIAKDYLKNV